MNSNFILYKNFFKIFILWYKNLLDKSRNKRRNQKKKLLLHQNLIAAGLPVIIIASTRNSIDVKSLYQNQTAIYEHIKISDDICVKFPSFEIIGEAAVENADTFAKEQASIDSKNNNFFDTEWERLMASLHHDAVEINNNSFGAEHYSIMALAHQDTNAETNAQFKTYFETYLDTLHENENVDAYYKNENIDTHYETEESYEFIDLLNLLNENVDVGILDKVHTETSFQVGELNNAFIIDGTYYPLLLYRPSFIIPLLTEFSLVIPGGVI